jgi:hypothetical protein
MEFSQIKNPIQQIGFNKYIIGDNPLNPIITFDQNSIGVQNVSADTVVANSDLYISGVSFIDYITGDVFISNTILNNYTSGRHTLHEAFELDTEGDLIPSNEKHISDTMWILRNENDLELRSNLWRYNTGPEAFTDEISF